MASQISPRVSIDCGQNRDARLAYPPCAGWLEHFPERWAPAFRKKMRPIENN
jgi:hypothetical protein